MLGVSYAEEVQEQSTAVRTLDIYMWALVIAQRCVQARGASTTGLYLVGNSRRCSSAGRLDVVCEPTDFGAAVVTFAHVAETAPEHQLRRTTVAHVDISFQSRDTPSPAVRGVHVADELNRLLQRTGGDTVALDAARQEDAQLEVGRCVLAMPQEHAVRTPVHHDGPAMVLLGF